MEIQKRYKICLLSDCYFPTVGGIQTHVYNLAQTLAAKGHSVHIVTNYIAFPVKKAGLNLLLQHEEHGIKLHYLHGLIFKGLNYRTFDLRIVRQATEIFKQERFDILHGHSVYSPLVLGCCLLAKQCNLPSVVTVHSLVGASLFENIAITFFRPFLRSPNGFIAVSQIAKEYLSRYVSTKPIFVVRNGVQLPPVTPDVRKQMRAKLGFSEADVVINCVSRFTAKKGILVLPQVCIESKFAQEGLSQQVRLVGSVPYEQVVNYLCASDIFIFPFRMESFGIALLEAMAVGLPVVACASNGALEVVKKGGDGLLAGSLEQFQHYLKLLIEDSLLRREFGMRGFISAQSRLHSWDYITDEILQVYSEIIG
jgi:glycosyltransferase involved in cell wall biosynthesis